MRCFNLALLLVLGPSVVDACSCVARPEITEAMVLDAVCAADFVFVGEVESSLHVRDSTYEYKVWPRIGYKGQVSSPAYALSIIEGMCGFPFQPDGKYLVFGDRHLNTDYYSSSICGFTRQYDKNGLVEKIVQAMGEDIEELCSEQSKGERRLEHIRNRIDNVDEIEKSTREHVESGA